MDNLETYFELESYGVKLKRLTHDKLEMVRQWRNDPKIQQYMFYRQEITPEMQDRWFSNLDKKRNFYFIIEYHGKDIGCINIRDINWDTKSGEPGIFIYDDEYLNSDVGMRASFCLGDWVWNELKLEAQTIEVVRTNKRALQLNKAAGYEELPLHSGDPKDMCRMVLTRDVAMKPNILFDRLKKIFNKTE